MVSEVAENRMPRVAIVDSNTLAAIGLRQILKSVIPIMRVEVLGSFVELEACDADSFVHYFVAMNIFIENRRFFEIRKSKTIVLTAVQNTSGQLSGFHSLCINQPEKLLIRELLLLEQRAHANGRNLPKMPDIVGRRILSDREIEVLALVAQGFLNKEIADKLCIGLATVITHRRNITEKLGLKSVSALTIYAVMHGYVDVGSI